jgi:DNA polymerase-3 subunit alpha
MIQSQYEMGVLESLGLLKIDFLGLRNLSSIDSIVKLVEENEGTKINIYEIPVDDPLTYELLRRVETVGVFQLESQGMKSLIGQMQMREFEDIVAVLALFRPGPMENIPSYIRRRNGVEKVTYPHPVLEEVLKNTNGIIVYQEQILKIAALFAGYSFGEADVLRRAVSKKSESALEAERKNFVSKSLERGHSNELSNEIYDYIVKFSNYGFNRAHSVAYAFVAYWMAYLKANYPKYFISVLTSSVIGSESSTRNYIYEAYKLNVKVLPPSVNFSTEIYRPLKNDLVFPLLGIKNVGRKNVSSLLEERQKGKFKSYVDFISRTHTFLNKRVLESLIKASALDEFGLTKHTMIERLEEVINFSQLGGFIDSEEFVIDQIPEYIYETLESFEKDVLGFNLVMNPLVKHQDYISKHNLLLPATLSVDFVGKEIRIMAILSYIRKIKTKNGNEMAFITLEDSFSKIDGVLFTNVYQLVKDDLFKGKVYLFKGKVEQRNNNLQLVIDKIHKMEE